MNCHRCGRSIDEAGVAWCDVCLFPPPPAPAPLPTVMRPSRVPGVFIGIGAIALFAELAGILAGWLSGLLW